MLPAFAGTRFIAFIAFIEFIEFIAFVEFIELIEFIAFIYLLQLVPCALCLPTPDSRLLTPDFQFTICALVLLCSCGPVLL